MCLDLATVPPLLLGRERIGYEVWARNILWNGTGGESMVLTVGVCISSASTDIDDTGRGVYEQHSDDQGRLLFVVEDLRLSTVCEFHVWVRLLFHPVAPLPSGSQSSLKAKCNELCLK